LTRENYNWRSDIFSNLNIEEVSNRCHHKHRKNEIDFNRFITLMKSKCYSMQENIHTTSQSTITGTEGLNQSMEESSYRRHQIEKQQS
jgi:hypothetical protein